MFDVPPSLLGGLFFAFAGEGFAYFGMHLFFDECGELVGEFRGVLDVLLGGFAALADHLTLVGNPGALLLEYLVLDAEVDQRAGVGDALTIHDVEFGLGEGWSDLVLYDLDASTVADDLAVALFDLADAADVHTDRREELKCATAGLCFGAAEHDADLFADLISKEDDTLCLGDGSGEAAHGLTHHTCLEANGGVSHLAVELVLGDEGGDGVDHDDVDCAGADQSFGDVEGILAAFGLGDHQVLQIDANDLGVAWVEGVLHIDKDGVAAFFLSLRDGAETESSLTGAFRAVDFADSSAGEAACAEREVDGDGTGGDDVDLHFSGFAEAHQGAGAELFIDAGNGEIEVLAVGFGGAFGLFNLCFCGHIFVLSVVIRNLRLTLEGQKPMARLNDNLFTTLVNHAIPREMGCWLQTRLGWVQLRFSEKGLSDLVFVDDCEGQTDSVFRDAFLEWLQVFQAADAATQWDYLDLEGTDFQKSVWRELLAIPFGGRTSYGAIAEKLGRPKAHRAVGTAVGANPVSVLVPCHRVLPSTGKSGNYRWGADRKVALLDAEQERGSDLCVLFQ